MCFRNIIRDKMCGCILESGTHRSTQKNVEVDIMHIAHQKILQNYANEKEKKKKSLETIVKDFKCFLTETHRHAFSYNFLICFSLI